MVYYNYALLSKLLTDYSNVLGSKISIWNEKLEPTDAHDEKSNDICTLIKQHIEYRCRTTDNAALNKSRNLDNAFFYHCHFGFIEIMVKEYIENIPFYICIGPFRDPKTERKMKRKISNFCKSVGVSSNVYLNHYKNIPLFEEEKYHSIVTILKTIIHRCIEDKIIAIKDDYFESTIDPFIKNNIEKNYSVLELSEKFKLSSKKFHQVIRKATGLTPKQYITKLKIDKAYNEIILTTKDLQQIASDIGIEDYNYFIKLFKRTKGNTPKYFRKEYE